VESRLVAGQIACTGCGGELRPWGHGRWRTLRDRRRGGACPGEWRFQFGAVELPELAAWAVAAAQMADLLDFHYGKGTVSRWMDTIFDRLLAR